jgi:hypothetical protein
MSNKKREIPDIANTVDDFSKGGNTYVSLPSILEKRGKDRKTITRFRNGFWKRCDTFGMMKHRVQEPEIFVPGLVSLFVFKTAERKIRTFLLAFVFFKKSATRCVI